MIKYLTIIFILLFCLQAFPQETSDSLSTIKKSFDNFEYSKVITIANNLLKERKELTKNQIIDIYRMKGISSFSLLQQDSAKDSFLEILKIDSSYTMDSAKTSPKIISFFNKIKMKFKQTMSEMEKQHLSAKPDTVFIKKLVPDLKREQNLKSALLRSIALPGLGHLYLGRKTKGWILSGLGGASLASMIYFIIDSNKKETAYLNTTNAAAFNSRYNNYNTSYHLRNYSIVAFAAVWLYSQIDLLFFQDNNTQKKLSFHNFPRMNFTSGKNLRIDFQLQF